MSDKKTISAELLGRVYNICYEFGVTLVGKRTSEAFMRSSRETVLPYFQYLSKFSVNEEKNLQIDGENITDKELLAFAAWMQRFIWELKHLLVGISHLDIRFLTEEIQQELEKIDFYEYYYQAQKLEY